MTNIALAILGLTLALLLSCTDNQALDFPSEEQVRQKHSSSSSSSAEFSSSSKPSSSSTLQPPSSSSMPSSSSTSPPPSSNSTPSSSSPVSCSEKTFNTDLYECKPDINPNGIYMKGGIEYGDKVYNAVLIGEQVWMAENLKYSASGSKCGNGNDFVDMNTSTCDIYGRLYNWATAMDACPPDWHIPSNAEWITLIYFVGTNAGTKLKSASGWGIYGNGTDDYGFSALPGGYVSSNFGGYLGEGNNGRWWSADTTESNAEYAHYREINTSMGVNSYSIPKSYLHSVRCVKD